MVGPKEIRNVVRVQNCHPTEKTDTAGRGLPLVVTADTSCFPVLHSWEGSWGAFVSTVVTRLRHGIH